MPTMCAARITTKAPRLTEALTAAGLPTHRAPTHPGEVLEEMLEDRGLSVAEAARRMDHIPAQRVHDIIKGRRNVSTETAILLGELFEMSAAFWVSLASNFDLWHALQTRAEMRSATIGREHAGHVQ